MEEQRMEYSMYGKTEDYKAEGRRESDHRFIKIEENINNLESDMKEVVKEVILVKTKIFNGFGTSIKNTQDKVNYIDEQNKEDHKLLRDDIKDLSKKLDKILWTFFGMTFIILASKAVEYFI